MGSHEAPQSGRRQYLDWLRGVAVIVMILGHGVDSWTQESDRDEVGYRQSLLVGGLAGAPVFLFLAGVALALAAGARTRAGRPAVEVAALARVRGWQVFGLAFLFRLQAWIISGGDPHRMLKVDILNVMGLSMLGAAVLWGWGGSQFPRLLLFSLATCFAAMVTPIVRASQALAGLPDPLEGYLRPVPDASFSLFPWAGFVFAGCAVGMFLDGARTPREERKASGALAFIGAAIALGGYGASFLPPIYAETSFWSSSPTFFFVRLGIVLCLLSTAYAVRRRAPGRSRLAEFGRSSLFVYWVHVELAYGVISMPLHGSLTLEQAMLGVIVLSLLMYALVRLKARFTKHGTGWWWSSPSRPGYPAG